MGAAALVVGLLLVLAAFGAASLPGWASFVRPGSSRASSPVRAFAASPIHPSTWYALGSIVVGSVVAVLGFAFVAAVASAGVSVLLAGIGVVLIAVAIEASRAVASIERRRVFAGVPPTDRPLPHPYRPLRGGLVEVLRAEFADENRWRDVLYVAVNLPLAVLELGVVTAAWTLSLVLLTSPAWFDAARSASGAPFGPLSSHAPELVALRAGLGLVLLPVAASASQLVMVLHRAVVTGLLCTPESRELRRQVETLRRSRSAVLETEATELHRIERDLHDGAQQRLVRLTMDLGLAAERAETDPEAARQLILESQDQARQALADIRGLVRGIAPAILLDRGLRAALESIVGRGAVPTTIVTDLAADERLPATVERTAYFVVAEALANVARHAGATRAEVAVRRARDAAGVRLVVEVRDDGAGGAAARPGGGLAGLERRLAGVDGTFEVASPPGGGTVVRATIPIAGG